MRRLVIALALLGMTAGLPALPASLRNFGLEDVARMKSVSDPQMSPDGAWVAYVVRTPDLKEDKNSSDIWMTSWDGKETVRLTTSKESESSPRWSPDGRYLAFLSSRDDDDEVSQVWLLPRSGGEAEKLTEREGRRRGLRLGAGRQAPRARRGRSRPRERGRRGSGKKKKKAKKPIVIDRFQFKLDVDGLSRKAPQPPLAFRRGGEELAGADDRRLRRRAARLVAGRQDHRLRLQANGRGRPDGQLGHLAIEPRQGAAPRQLTTDERADNQPDWGSRLAWSPDSKSIAYVQGGPDKLIYYGLHRLAVVSAAGGAPRILTAVRRPERAVARSSRPTARRSCSRSRTTRRSASRRSPRPAARSSGS